MSPIDPTLLTIMSDSDIDRTRTSLLQTESIIHETQKFINTIDVSEERRDELRDKILELEKTYDTVNNRISEIDDVLQKQVGKYFNSNNSEQLSIDEWIKTNDFADFNEDIKIKQIQVFVTNNIIVGLKLIMKNDSFKNKGNTNGSVAKTINFGEGEFLTSVSIKTSSQIPGLCKQIIFYTNLSANSPKESVPRGKISISDNLKEYSFRGESLTWEQHRDKARRYNMELVCINSAEENQTVNRISGRRNIWIGLYHENMDTTGRGSNNRNQAEGRSPGWKWVDGTEFYKPNGSNVFHQWQGGEPNDCCSGEPVVNMWWNSNWNDHNLRARFPAVYQKVITNRNDNLQNLVGFQIVDIYFNPFDGIYQDIYKINETALDAAKNISNNVTNINSTLLSSSKLLNEIKTQLITSKNDIKSNIQNLEELIRQIDDANNIGGKAQETHKQYQREYGGDTNEGFSNMENFFNINIFKKIIDFFYPNTIIEGATGMDQVRSSEFTEGTDSLTSETRSKLIDTVNKMDELQDVEIKNAFSEFLSKKDFVFSSVLTDYMINNEDNTDISKLYEKVKQDNDNKHRQMGINTYYNKAYKEYINMIKVVIFVTIILIPVLLLNKNEILPKNITLFIIVAAIFLTSVYLIYKFYDLYMRDTKNFDKIKIPYDRTGERLIGDGKLKDKSFSGTFGITCIGDECCDTSMVYDSLTNKCVLANNDSTSNQFNRVDGFTNFFENRIQEQFNNKKSLVEPFSCETNFTNSLIGSLNASNTSEFNKNINASSIG